MRSCIVLALVLPWLGGIAVAEEDKTASARAHLRAGIAYYDDGRYDDAAREMEAAYRLKPLADLQYNLAQCYERLNRLADAAGAYRSYLTGRPNADDRDAVMARVQNLEQRAKQEKEGQPIAPPIAPPMEKVVFKTLVVYRDAPPGRGVRIASVVVGALALAALGGGITFTVLARRDADQVSSGGSGSSLVGFDAQARTQTAGQADQVVAGVSYGVAGLAAVGAIGLWVLGNKIDRDAKSVAFAPTVTSHGGGFALAGSF